MKLSLRALCLTQIGVSLLAFSSLCEAGSKKPQSSRCEPCCREIREVPFTIKVPGEYVINQSITYRGSASAITVADVGNVKIKFNSASLFLTDPNAIGIDIQNAHEVTITEDEITFIGDQEFAGSGISIKQSDTVTITNCFFNKCGLTFTESSNINVNKISIENHTRAGAIFRACTNIALDGCVFKDNVVGVTFGATATSPNKDCQLVRCNFPNSKGTTNLLAQQVTGLTVNDCTFSTNGGPIMRSLAQFGDDTAVANSANNVAINRCSFINASISTPPDPSANFRIEGIVHLNGSGITIDSTVVDVDHGDSQTPGINPAAIRLSGTVGGATVRNSVIKGIPFIGIYCLNVVDGGALIDNCTVPLAFAGVLIESSNDCTIKNSTLPQCGVGILSFFSTNGSISTNTISQCSAGIQLSDNASFTINGNTISQCDFGISLTGTTTNTVTINNVLNDNVTQYDDGSSGSNLEQDNIKQPA